MLMKNVVSGNNDISENVLATKNTLHVLLKHN